ncbi:L-asparaginase [Calocera cornea HHB12733]|uniref:asparaginase n=1 Tax=Calocera cornea HHB12733 TaxID=1353952 RepID=A0A165JTE4_9BASI|nr:L-asparaginase [Calocera cornea HHB12733]
MLFTSVLAGLALAGAASARVEDLPRHLRLAYRDLVNTTSTNGNNASLPKIVYFGTGGTIAGSSGSATAVTGYQAGALGVQTLIDAVPEIINITNIIGIQFANVASDQMNTTLTMQLSRNISEYLAADDVVGAVVSHGTDTLEETAIMLDLTIKSDKPVVIVGAMRPATAISADGPYNLLQAVSLATYPGAAGRGTMITLNDRIGSAFYTTKTNPRSLDTFKAYEQGYLGNFVGATPRFWYEPAKVLNKPYFDVTNFTTLPHVAILYAYEDMALDVPLVSAAIASGVKGLVIAGSGDGGTDSTWNRQFQSLCANASVAMVVSTRTGDGSDAPDGDSSPTISANSLNPEKAKIMLQLSLAKNGYNITAIKKDFDSDYPTLG